jgi:hypothetical protein
MQLANLRSVWNSFNRTVESAGFQYLSTMPLCGSMSIYPDIAQVLKATCPPGTSVVMQDVGAIPFYSGVNTIDIIGLCDTTLAHAFYRYHFTDYLRGRLGVPLLLEVDQFVRDYVIEKRKADYILYHVDVDRGEPDDLAKSYHYHFLYFDDRFDSLYQRIAEFRYPVTDRLDHILFERIKQ